MTAVEKVIRELARLPEPPVNEVLDFIAYLEIKHGLKDTGVVKHFGALAPTTFQTAMPAICRTIGCNENSKA